MANDGISMRGITRAESSSSKLDAGQIISKNQLLNSLTGSTGDGGFQQVLNTQVTRNTTAQTNTSATRNNTRNDNASRSSGNDSPQGNALQRNSSASAPDNAKKNTKPVDRHGNARTDVRRATTRDDARKPAESTRRSDAKAAGESVEASRSAKAKTKPTKSEAESPTAETANANATGTPDASDKTTTSAEAQTQNAETSVQGESASKNESECKGECAADANSLNTDATAVAAETIAVSQTMSLLSESVPTVTVADAMTTVVENNSQVTETGATEQPLPSPSADADNTEVTSGAFDVRTAQQAREKVAAAALDLAANADGDATLQSATDANLSEDTAQTAAQLKQGVEPTPAAEDPALKDLLTAMIRSRQNTDTGAVSVSTKVQSSADVAGTQSQADSAASTAEQAVASLTRELRGADAKPAWAVSQNHLREKSYLREQTTAMKQGNSAGVSGEIAIGEVEAGEITTGKVATGVSSVLPEGEAVIEVSTTQTDLALDGTQTEEAIEAPEMLLEESEPVDTEATTKESLVLEAGNDTNVTQEKKDKPSSTLQSSLDSVATDDALDAVSTATTEPSDSSVSWSILDDVAVMPEPDANNAVPKGPPPPMQQEQQMAQVRNELRNLERLVDGGLQSGVVRSASRKDDKATESKPAAISRALENLGAGAKTPELRAANTVSNTPVAFGRQGFAEQMAEKIMLMTTQKVQVAEIRLDPKEMGTIDVKIRVHQDQAQVVFSSANPQVREALETSLPRLREMFADAGVGLGSVNVNDRGTSAGGGNEQSQGRGDGGGFAMVDDAAEERAPRQPRQPNGLVDYYA